MTLEQYNHISRELLVHAACISDAKRPAYTLGSDDCLINFRSVAERMGITPMQAWGVYFNKHIDAINSAAKDPALPQAEAIKGRFADGLNYLLLGYALLTETRPEMVQKGDL